MSAENDHALREFRLYLFCEREIILRIPDIVGESHHRGRLQRGNALVGGLAGKDEAFERVFFFYGIIRPGVCCQQSRRIGQISRLENVAAVGRRRLHHVYVFHILITFFCSDYQIYFISFLSNGLVSKVALRRLPYQMISRA